MSLESIYANLCKWGVDRPMFSSFTTHSFSLTTMSLLIFTFLIKKLSRKNQIRVTQYANEHLWVLSVVERGKLVWAHHITFDGETLLLAVASVSMDKSATAEPRKWAGPRGGGATTTAPPVKVTQRLIVHFLFFFEINHCFCRWINSI